MPMNLGTDGIQFWCQNGFEGWPIAITPLSLSPEERARNKYQLLVAVTPGPKQPVVIALCEPVRKPRSFAAGACILSVSCTMNRRVRVCHTKASFCRGQRAQEPCKIMRRARVIFLQFLCILTLPDPVRLQ